MKVKTLLALVLCLLLTVSLLPVSAWAEGEDPAAPALTSDPTDPQTDPEPGDDLEDPVADADDDDPPAPAEPQNDGPAAKDGDVLADGFYLIGPDWTISAINSNNRFGTNPANASEYMLATTLTQGQKIKVVKVENNAITNWYPDGVNNEYTVDASHAGSTTIYFQETYKSDWSGFGGYFYVAEATAPAQTYTIYQYSSRHGTVSVKNASNETVTTATAGTVLHLDVAAETGYVATTYKIYLGSPGGSSTEYSINDTFTMPASNIYYSVFYRPIQSGYYWRILNSNGPVLTGDDMIASQVLSFDGVYYTAPVRFNSIGWLNVRYYDADTHKVGDNYRLQITSAETGSDRMILFNPNVGGDEIHIGYPITVVQPQHGTISTLSGAGKNWSVTVNATPDDGYRFDSLTVTDANGDPVNASGSSFTMPDSSVTVTASFMRNKFTATMLSTLNGEAGTTSNDNPGYNTNTAGEIRITSPADQYGKPKASAAGTTVSFRVTLNNAGYTYTLTAVDEGGSPVEITEVSTTTSGNKVITNYSLILPTSDVTVTAAFTGAWGVQIIPNPTWIDENNTRHRYIDMTDAEKAMVYSEVSATPAIAHPGDTVTVTIAPNPGYFVKFSVMSYNTFNNTMTKVGDYTYTFVVPEDTTSSIIKLSSEVYTGLDEGCYLQIDGAVRANWIFMIHDNPFVDYADLVYYTKQTLSAGQELAVQYVSTPGGDPQLMKTYTVQASDLADGKATVYFHRVGEPLIALSCLNGYYISWQDQNPAHWDNNTGWTRSNSAYPFQTYDTHLFTACGEGDAYVKEEELASGKPVKVAHFVDGTVDQVWNRWDDVIATVPYDGFTSDYDPGVVFFRPSQGIVSILRTYDLTNGSEDLCTLGAPAYCLDADDNALMKFTLTPLDPNTSIGTVTVTAEGGTAIPATKNNDFTPPAASPKTEEYVIALPTAAATVTVQLTEDFAYYVYKQGTTGLPGEDYRMAYVYDDTAGIGYYKFEQKNLLAVGDSIHIVKVENGAITAHYPSDSYWMPLTAENLDDESTGTEIGFRPEGFVNTSFANDTALVFEDGSANKLFYKCLYATIVINSHSITLVADAAACTVAGLPESADAGATVTFTVTPADGRKVTSVKVAWNDGNEAHEQTLTPGDAGSYTFTMPAYNVTVTVTTGYVITVRVEGVAANIQYSLWAFSDDYVSLQEGQTPAAAGGVEITNNVVPVGKSLGLYVTFNGAQKVGCSISYDSNGNRVGLEGTITPEANLMLTDTVDEGPVIITLTVDPVRITLFNNFGGNEESYLGTAPVTTTIPDNPFTRPGYVFQYWTEEMDGSGTPYMPGQEVTLNTDFALWAQWALEDGYYLLGNMHQWNVNNLTPADRFTPNTQVNGEYLLTHTFDVGTDAFKVVELENGQIKNNNYYGTALPNHTDNDGNYVIGDQTGTKTVYFRPDWNNEWNGYIYLGGVVAPWFNGHSLLLTGQIGVQFFMNLPGGPTAYPNSYMTISGNKVDGEYHYAEPKVVDFGGGDIRYAYTVFISSVQMADKFTPVFHYFVDDEEKTITGDPYAAEDYIQWGLAHPEGLDGKALAVVRALADYGYYAQRSLSKVNGWTIGEKYAEMTTKVSDSFDYNVVSAAVAQYEVDRSVLDGLNFRVVFSSLTNLEMRFKTVEGAEVKLDGTTVTPNVSGAYSVVTVKGIKATGLTQSYTLQVEETSVNISPMSYVQVMLGSTSANTDDDLRNLLCAFYYYGVACAAYKN